VPSHSLTIDHAVDRFAELCIYDTNYGISSQTFSDFTSFTGSAHSGRNALAINDPSSHVTLNGCPTQSNRHNPHPIFPNPLKNFPALLFSPSTVITAGSRGGNTGARDGS